MVQIETIFLFSFQLWGLEEQNQTVNVPLVAEWLCCQPPLPHCPLFDSYTREIAFGDVLQYFAMHSGKISRSGTASVFSHAVSSVLSTGSTPCNWQLHPPSLFPYQFNAIARKTNLFTFAEVQGSFLLAYTKRRHVNILPWVCLFR